MAVKTTLKTRPTWGYSLNKATIKHNYSRDKATMKYASGDLLGL
jgi:hypothetical protein